MSKTRILQLMLFSIPLLGLNGYAHNKDLTDWRSDTEAFKTAKPVPLPAVTLLDKIQSRDFDIDPAFLKQKLSEFSGATSVMIDGNEETITERKSSKGRQLAMAFLTQEYQALGFTTSKHTYSTGTNFIAEKPGADPSRVLLLTAHLDSVGNAGADDDGSGTIAVLAIAKAFAGLQFKYTLRIVGFDQEELGLVGSQAYVSSLTNKAEIIGDIQLDMVGTNMRGDGAFHVMHCNRSDSTFLADAVLKEVTSLSLPLKYVRACTNRSDHSSFWKKNIPAIAISENFFGGDGDPCYHAKCDIVDDRIKFDYSANIAKAIASAASQILEIQ
jgi:Zn-dependent M28 family amino/carboxypeptidase